MNLFDKIKEPIFIKENCSMTEQLEKLEALHKASPPQAITQIEQDLRNVRAGLVGEERIAFELKNSHIPMVILRDLCLQFGGLAAQIDVLVITRRRNFIIECKNLYGDLEITNQGDFIRRIAYNGQFTKERIYSPITQNERHLALIKQIRAAQKSNILSKIVFESNFAQTHRSVIVLANPKTVLNDRYAKKEIKQLVIPLDRLIAHIKAVNAEKGAQVCSEKSMMQLAQYFLSLHQPPPPSASKPVLCPQCGALMILRTATKGTNAGNTFYGCTNFPNCRGIVDFKSQSETRER